MPATTRRRRVSVRLLHVVLLVVASSPPVKTTRGTKEERLDALNRHIRRLVAGGDGAALLKRLEGAMQRHVSHAINSTDERFAYIGEPPVWAWGAPRQWLPADRDDCVGGRFGQTWTYTNHFLPPGSFAWDAGRHATARPPWVASRRS